MKPVFVVIFLIYGAATAPSAYPTGNTSKHLNISTPINRGRYGIWDSVKASIEDYPYNAVIMQTAFDKVIGGGMIYKDRWIITSGETATWEFRWGIYVRVGSANATSGGQRFDVTEVLVNPEYGYCAALLKLSKKIKFGKTAQPIKIANRIPPGGSYAVITGFGEPYSPELRSSVTYTIDRDKCLAEHTPGDLTSIDFCALSDPAKQDGGDVLTYNGQAVGLFIRDSDSMLSYSPGVYCDLTKVQKWIDQAIKDD